MKYKNISNSARTFYGVSFKPGEVKDVKGYINVADFIAVDQMAKGNKVESKQQTAGKAEDADQEKKSSDKPKEEKKN